MGVPRISISDYDYSLKEDQIAKYPISPRDNAKMLVYDSNEITHTTFIDLAEFLSHEDTMYVNNTKVIPARLWFKKESGAPIQIFLLKPLSPDWTVWEALVGNRRKFKEGDELSLMNENELNLTATWQSRDDNHIHLRTDADVSIPEVIEKMGEVPLPPYVNRETEDSDKDDYQAIFAKERGAVAAPTASLHFTDRLLESLQSKGVTQQDITLHVGAGTFKPVSTDFVDEHEMHAEQFSVEVDAIDELLKRTEGVLAVGTTSARVLESLPLLGAKRLLGQKKEVFVSSSDGYREELKHISTREALLSLREWCVEMGGELKGETQIFMVPGFDFRLTQKMITNFHQPKSTLILLIAAFIGDDWRKVYASASGSDYRFLSYGDGSLLVGKKNIRL